MDKPVSIFAVIVNGVVGAAAVAVVASKDEENHQRCARILTTMRFTFELKARISECGD